MFQTLISLKLGSHCQTFHLTFDCDCQIYNYLELCISKIFERFVKHLPNILIRAGENYLIILSFYSY